jgi:hypothetical protein
MPRHHVAFLAVAASLGLSLPGTTLVAQVAPAARSGGPGVLGTKLLGLVTHPAVQVELKTTDEQRGQLKALSEREEQQRLRWIERIEAIPKENEGDQIPTQRGQAVGDSRGMGGDGDLGNLIDMGPQDPFATMIESRMGIQQSTERSIARILSRAQYARARQIQLQVAGPDALLRPELQEKLYLNEEQVARLRDLIQERRRALRAAREARNAAREAALDRDPSLVRLEGQLTRNDRPDRSGDGDRAGEVDRNDTAYREARNRARRKLDEDRASRNPTAAKRTAAQAVEQRFDAALHSRILTKRQSQAYKAMLGAPFDPARPLAPAKEGSGPSAIDPHRGGDPGAERSAAARGPGATATPSRKTLRERRGPGTSIDPP